MKNAMEDKVCYCGSEPILYENRTKSGNLVGYSVMCPCCQTRTEITGTKIAAINHWNQRKVCIPTLSTRLKKRIAEIKERQFMCKELFYTITK